MYVFVACVTVLVSHCILFYSSPHYYINNEGRASTAEETGYVFADGETFAEMNDASYVGNYEPANNSAMLPSAQNYCSIILGKLGTFMFSLFSSSVNFSKNIAYL